MAGLDFSKKLNRLDQRIKEIKSQLECLPEGALRISCQTGHFYYRYRLPDSSVHYIPKSNCELASDLAFRKYLELQMKDLTIYRDALSKCEKNLSGLENHAYRYLQENKGVRELLKDRFPVQNAPLAVWAAQPPCEDAPFQENRIFKCLNGIKMRSKSENLIGDRLHLAKIPFRYEDPLRLGNQIIYPDFTIRHPLTGDYMYWEHLGRMSDPDYIRRNTNKIARYAANGFVPNHDLILTFESDEKPLTPDQIDLMIDYFFR